MNRKQRRALKSINRRMKKAMSKALDKPFVRPNNTDAGRRLNKLWDRFEELTNGS